MWTEKEIRCALFKDKDIRKILQILVELQLKDSWICAGTVRNFIWNLLSNQEGFDKETCQIELELKKKYPQYKWEVKNQVYMHVHSPNTLPYTSSQDAITKYPETCTAVGIRLSNDGELELFCPYGLESITSFAVRPTPHFQVDEKRMVTYRQRLAKKDWFRKWPRLHVYET
ncbi:nucleotidyltransferase family protein [Streptococcus ovis]|uniref:nucleotidyltransferase family protein n=1 Tax=Streptococcus ovis TaxID=82806 RepID=UPI0003626CFC|nr:nucleotidyltransferase family protein [Streptococcus ovis]